MPLSNYFSWLNPQKRRAERARAELVANAEKALRMKQEGTSETQIPPHQTPREGMRPGPAERGADLKREADFTPQLKRSRAPRTGDAS